MPYKDVEVGRAKARERYQATREERIAYDKRRYRQPERNKSTREHAQKSYYANPGKARSQRLKCNFGITLEDYNKLLDAQNGVCAICHRPERRITSKKRGTIPNSLCVDHVHATGRVRGLLCSNCNIAVGMLGDNIDRCLAAAIYLENHKDYDHDWKER